MWEVVAKLEARVAGLEAENAALRAENAALRKALEEERRAGKRQAGPFSRNNPKSNPKKPGRKPGGDRVRREIPRKIDEHVVVGVPVACRRCGGRVKLKGKVSQYQIDIPPVEPKTIEFEIHYGQCLRCGRRVQGRDPRQVTDATGTVGGVHLGPSAIAMTAHLNKACGLSYERIAELFEQVFRLKVSRSGLARALLRLGRKAAPTYAALLDEIQRAEVVYPDETGWRIGGVRSWLWAATNLVATVYLIEQGRGFAQAAKLLGEAFAGVIGADGWHVYRKFSKAQRQLCLAHLLRRCRELLAVPPTLECAAYVTAIKQVLQDALSLRDRRATLSTHGFRVAKGRLESRLDQLLDDPDLDDESLTFALHLLNNRDAIFTFLTREDVEAANWPAEQAIRPAVINRKTSGGNRTKRGATSQAILMSVLRTCKQQCHSAMDAFRDMLTAPQPVAVQLVR